MSEVPLYTGFLLALSAHTVAYRGILLSLQSFLRKGVSLGYVGLNQNLKGLKDLNPSEFPSHYS